MVFIIYLYRCHVMETNCKERGDGNRFTTKKNFTPDISSLGDIKDDAFMHISTYLDTSDIYNLCRVSKRFHESDSQLTKSMMGCRLKANLGKALIQSNIPGFTIESFNELCELCSPHQVVISGGITAKAILGKQWVSDVDIYVDYQVAKRVRSWFIKKWQQILIDAKPFYGNEDNQEDTIFLRERYTTMPKENAEITDRRNHHHLFFKRSEVYRRRLLLRINSWSQYYCIETIDGGKTLPYSSLLMHRKHMPWEDPVVNIDLIIGCPGVHLTDVIANNTDLSICENTYNGKIFRVYHPSTSFVGSSVILKEPFCFDFIKCYMQTLASLCLKDRSLTANMDDGRKITICCKGTTLFARQQDWSEFVVRVTAHGECKVQGQMTCNIHQVNMLRSNYIERAAYLSTHAVRHYETDDPFKLIYFNRWLFTHNNIIRQIIDLIGYVNQGVHIKNVPNVFSMDIGRYLPAARNNDNTWVMETVHDRISWNRLSHISRDFGVDENDI